MIRRTGGALLVNMVLMLAGIWGNNFNIMQCLVYLAWKLLGAITVFSWVYIQGTYLGNPKIVRIIYTQEGVYSAHKRFKSLRPTSNHTWSYNCTSRINMLLKIVTLHVSHPMQLIKIFNTGAYYITIIKLLSPVGQMPQTGDIGFMCVCACMCLSIPKTAQSKLLQIFAQTWCQSLAQSL